MTALQQLAIRRIKTLVESIEPQMTAYAMHREMTQEDAMKRDRESSATWGQSNNAQREAVEWASALLAEKK